MSSKKILLAVDYDLVTKSTSTALYSLVEGGLPVEQALVKLGINRVLITQIMKIADTYIDYYIEGEEVFEEKLAANTPKIRAYIEACVDLKISSERAEAEFANTLVESVMIGTEENPELALKVLERRFSDDWGSKKQVDVKVNKTETIKTIQINVPTPETFDVDFEDIGNEEETIL